MPRPWGNGGRNVGKKRGLFLAGRATAGREGVMGLLADWQIKEHIKIEPFAEGNLRPGTISFGLSSYGYDVRVGRHFKVFTNVYGAIVDPKNFNTNAFVDIEAD